MVISSPRRVGSYPKGASPHGGWDMAGNAWEWVQDSYDEKYYATSPTQNPISSVSGMDRVLRGGAWSSQQKLSVRRSRETQPR